MSIRGQYCRGWVNISTVKCLYLNMICVLQVYLLVERSLTILELVKYIMNTAIIWIRILTLSFCKKQSTYMRWTWNNLIINFVNGVKSIAVISVPGCSGFWLFLRLQSVEQLDFPAIDYIHCLILQEITGSCMYIHSVCIVYTCYIGINKGNYIAANRISQWVTIRNSQT